MMRSDSIDELGAALANAQAELAPVARDSSASTDAYTYAYASLTEVLESLRPVLNRHGLAVTQTVVARIEPILAEQVEQKRGRDGNPIEQRIPVQSLGSVRTTLAHNSGQWIASEVPAVHVPTADVRTWRELITYRSRVIAKRTRAKNSVRTLLRCAGVVPPSRPGLWTKKGLEGLRPRLAGTSGWSRASTSRGTGIGWGTSPARGRRWSGSWSPRRPGRRCGGRRRSGRIPSGCGRVTRSGRRSLWWRQRTTWCG
jgi:hypothetical protein